MSIPTIRFEAADFVDALPSEGYHESVVSSARFRTSAAGNRTLQVVYRLKDVTPGFDQVTEYFVIDGVEARARAIARRRLLGLCRSCGVEPQQDEPLALDRLVGARLRVRLGHESYEGGSRLRVLGHRPVGR
jgi:hypothetical protein